VGAKREVREGIAKSAEMHLRPRSAPKAPRAHDVFSACGADTQPVHGSLL
jgi:hypothetical protein